MDADLLAKLARRNQPDGLSVSDVEIEAEINKDPAYLELVKAVQPQLEAKYKDFVFQRFLPLNIQQTAAELEGKKKVPQP